MELIFKRKPHRGILRRTRFVLHARFSLDEDERALIQDYHFRNAVMIDLPNPGLWARAILLSIVIFPLVFGLLWQLFPEWVLYDLGIYNVSIWPILFASSFIFSGVVGFIYYHQRRTTIYVRDLIHGRYFNCPSVIELACKEAVLYAMSDHFRQVLER